MATNQQIPVAASRRWLYIGGGFFLLLIGFGMLYRQITGSTVREQRLESQRQKAMSELASKPKPNAEAFSAKLASKRQEIEDKERREAEAASRLAPAVPAPRPEAPASAPAQPAGMPSGKPGQKPGTRTAGEIDEEQLASFEMQRQQQQADLARKLLGWEAQADRQSVAAALAGLPGTQAAGGGDSTVPRPAQAGQPGGITAASLIEAYQKAQGAANSSTGGDGDESFKRQVSSRPKEKQPLTAQPGLGRYAVHEGTLLEVAMRTGVSSDVAGDCRAQVVRDVYDSVTGMERVIPKGSTALCTYNASVVQGQERLLLVFTSLRFPSGAKVELGSMDGADEQGVVGAPAEVNTRFWRVFGSSFLIAMITRFAEQKPPSGGVTVNTTPQSGNPAAQVLSEVAKKSLERNLNIKPELRLNPGDRLTVVVKRDMVLDPAITGVNR